MPYEVIIGNMTYGSSVLSDISMSTSIGDFGLKGVATRCLTFRLYDVLGGLTFSKGESVELVVNSMSFMLAHIDDVSRDGNVLSITAYDRCSRLDEEYDMTGKAQYQTDQTTGELDKARPCWWAVSQIVGEIRAQCGFTGVTFSPQRVYKSSTDRPSSQAAGAFLCYNDLNGKTCRQILDEISATECGYFCSSNGGSLDFETFSPPRSGQSITDDHTEICLQGDKQIMGTYATAGISGEERSAGSSPDARVDISSRYMTADNFTAASSQVMSGGSWTMCGWNVDKVADSNGGLSYELGGTIAAEGQYLRICSIRKDFRSEVIVSMSAPKPDTATRYMTKAERERKQGIYLGMISGDAVMISRSGGMEAVPNKTAEKAAPVSGGGA